MLPKRECLNATKHAKTFFLQSTGGQVELIVYFWEIVPKDRHTVRCDKVIVKPIILKRNL